MPPPMPEPPRSGLPAWAWVAVVLAAVLGVTAVIVVLVTREPREGAGGATTSPVPTEASPTVVSPTPTAASPTEASPTPTEVSPTAFDDLAALVPPPVTDCQSLEPGGIYEAAMAVAYCATAGRSDVTAYFYMFATENEAAATYDSIRQAQGYVPDTGSCSSGEGGELAWEGGGSGRIMCGAAGDRPTLLWTSDGFAIIGQLTPVSTEMELGELFRVWQDIPNYAA